MTTKLSSEGSSGLALEYSTITGFFLQDDPQTDTGSFDYTSVNFGLKNRDHKGEESLWQTFGREVERLNKEAEPNIQFKVLFLGRHGNGVHNKAESLYGTPAWDRYWSKLEGDGVLYWADAHLTDLGIQQAQIANAFWKHLISTEMFPLPQTYYSSPLDRCLATANWTFADLDLPSSRPFVPTVKELLREANGVHTCDRRSTKTYIRNNYPGYNIEAGFVENDELWDPDIRESDLALDARLRRLLDDIFKHDESMFISLTSHSGAITSILRVIGHRPFRLVTGSTIPVLVKAVTNDNLPHLPV